MASTNSVVRITTRLRRAKDCPQKPPHDACLLRFIFLKRSKQTKSKWRPSGMVHRLMDINFLHDRNWLVLLISPPSSITSFSSPDCSVVSGQLASKEISLELPVFWKTARYTAAVLFISHKEFSYSTPCAFQELGGTKRRNLTLKRQPYLQVLLKERLLSCAESYTKTWYGTSSMWADVTWNVRICRPQKRLNRILLSFPGL